MIAEEKKDLIDKRELYQLIKHKMNERYNGVTLYSALTFKEILEIFNQLPLYNELETTVYKQNDKWTCNWCQVNTYTTFVPRYCHSCGRRIKGVLNENQKR